MKLRNASLPLTLALVACAGAEDLETHTDDILASYTDQVGLCQWPSVVQVQSKLSGGYVGFCTGTIIGDRVLVTAAHCLDGASKLWVDVGENGASAVEHFELDEDAIASRCATHPHGEPVSCGGLFGGDCWSGVDVAYCKLTESEYPSGLVTIAPLAHNSCEEDYFHTTMIGRDVTIVGMGAERVNTSANPYNASDFGTKRAVTGRILRHVLYSGEWFLEVSQPILCNDDAIVRGGDSGSPVFTQMEDGTWRQVGIAVAIADAYNSAECSGGIKQTILVQPLAEHLPWIEADANRDATRCHDFNPATFSFDYHGNGQCYGYAYPLHPGQTMGRTWAKGSCSKLSDQFQPVLSGQCAGWDPCGGLGTWPTCNQFRVAQSSSTRRTSLAASSLAARPSSRDQRGLQSFTALPVVNGTLLINGAKIPTSRRRVAGATSFSAGGN